MSQSNPSFQLILTLRKSPALLRCQFCPDRTASLSRGDPLYKLHYLGTEKIYSLEMEQAQGAISRLLQQRAPEKPGKAHALVVRPRYVEVKDIATGRQLAKTYLRDIAFCAADTDNPNVFLYICKQQGPQLQLQCRVFWCSSAERAKDITACFAQSFQTALRDWQGQGVEPIHTGDGEGPSVVGGLSINASHHPDSFTISAELRTGENILSLFDRLCYCTVRCDNCTNLTWLRMHHIRCWSCLKENISVSSDCRFWSAQ
uniref:PID domain-containing protein n=1 Tax=Esox lucius TaxID=8010 RepID=A0AAY5K593_ESOLU